MHARTLVIPILVVSLLFFSQPLTVQSYQDTSKQEQLRELIIELQNRLFELQRLLALKKRGYEVDAQQRIGSVDGPRIIPVGADGVWNQSSAMSPTQTSFALKDLKWDWGDGTVTTADNTHAYAKQGTYHGTVKAYSPDGKVLDSASFIVNVVAPAVYDISITQFNAGVAYQTGDYLQVAWKTVGADTFPVAVFTGFMLVSELSGNEYFLTDAYDGKSGTAQIKIPGVGDYSQDGVIAPGAYRLKAYLYGSGVPEYASSLSETFVIR